MSSRRGTAEEVPKEARDKAEGSSRFWKEVYGFFACFLLFTTFAIVKKLPSLQLCRDRELAQDDSLFLLLATLFFGALIFVVIYVSRKLNAPKATEVSTCFLLAATGYYLTIGLQCDDCNIFCHVLADPASLLMSLFFFAGFFLVVRLKITVNLDSPKTKSYPDFDLAVATLEQSIKTHSVGDGLYSPLLLPPPSCIYHLEDRQFGILHKKSGDVFLQGFTARSVMRLHFSTEGSENGFASLLGGSRILIPSVAPVATNNNSSNDNVKANSCFVVQKGLVSLSTKMAYFEESNNGIGGTTRRVVSGKFEDGFTSFSGEWLDSKGIRGCLTTYMGAISTAGYVALEEGEQQFTNSE